MSAVDVGMDAEQVEVARHPLDDVGDGATVTVLLCQLGLIEQRMGEVAVLLLGAGSGSTRAVARLNFEWSTLEAWLEFISSMETTPKAVRRLWALSPLTRVRTRLRRLLQQGAAYGQDPGAPLGLVAQLHRLATKLKVHEDLVAGLVDGPGPDAAQSSVSAMYIVASELDADDAD
jgi:hypothetical protein